MAFGSRPIEMNSEELHLLADVLSRASGFVLREDLKFIAERRLAPRLELWALPDFHAYVRFLRFDARGAEELEVALELLVPHETYFFREPLQLHSFATELMPILRAGAPSGHRRLQLWSAGCSTGEEAYTLSALLHGHPQLDGWELDVLGTDLSRKALTTARRAEYGTTSLRATSPEQKAEFFEPTEAGKVRVREAIRSRVRFGQLNLLDESAAAVLPRFDAIFCRNVLIYFDAPTRRRVTQLFFDRLRDGGVLLLGHSEHLLQQASPFELLPLEGDLVYRRPAS